MTTVFILFSLISYAQAGLHVENGSSIEYDSLGNIGGGYVWIGDTSYQHLAMSRSGLYSFSFGNPSRLQLNDFYGGYLHLGPRYIIGPTGHLGFGNSFRAPLDLFGFTQLLGHHSGKLIIGDNWTHTNFGDDFIQTFGIDSMPRRLRINPLGGSIVMDTYHSEFSLNLGGSEVNDEPDFAIYSNDALIQLGKDESGPHGFTFGDADAGEGMKLFYRSGPNEMVIEPGNDISDDTNPLFRLLLDGKMYATGLRNIGDKKNMQYNSSTGEIGYDNSSRRYKNNISTLEDDWKKILLTRPVRYTRPASPDHWEYGYIAEEIDSIGLHNLVGYDAQCQPDDVKYDRMVIYLTELVKQHHQAIQDLRRENASLRNHLRVRWHSDDPLDLFHTPDH